MGRISAFLTGYSLAMFDLVDWFPQFRLDKLNLSWGDAAIYRDNPMANPEGLLYPQSAQVRGREQKQ